MNEKFLHKKSLGQNFLNSDFVPKKMCDAASLIPDETVLEIGPGTGALTKELLSRGVKVVAVEADKRAITSLEETFSEAIASGQLSLHHADARKLNLKELGLINHEYKTVSNIPYYLSGLLFRTLLETDIQPTTLVFLVQKEVAERIARDKKGSLLSISIKVFGDPTYVSTIKRGHFNPPPKIDSAIIKVTDISTDRLKNVTSADFFTLLNLGFGQKRKQLAHNLSKDHNKEQVVRILGELDLPATTRAEDISAKKWVELANHLL